MEQFIIEDKKLTVCSDKEPVAPVIYLNTVSEEAEEIYEILKKITHTPFTLAAVSGLDWNFDMAPWDSPSAIKNGPACTGGADKYLKFMAEKIIPEAEKSLFGGIAWRGIAGYSLAGLFSVYSLYCTGIFSRAASISGSLWYPGFKEYVFSHEMKNKPDRMYFSLGNKESRTQNPYLRTVKENTEEIQTYYKNKGINTIFQMNPGGHYYNTAERTAAGIAWLLEG